MGDIALDDIWFDDSPCPAPGSCHFESQSFCTWSQIPNKANRTGYDDFDWILNSGRTPSWNTGPTVDHTLGTALGTYAFIEATGLKPGSKAQLKSEVLPSTDGRCLSFFYHMKGSGIGKLNLYVQPSGGVMKLSKTIDGSQVNSWVQGEVNLASRIAFNVIIEAVHGTNFRGDISLDDINILEGNCVGTCSSVKLTARVACGPNIIDESTCRLNYGCCYDDTYPNMPKCFQHPATCEAVPLELRRKCGYSGISKYSCTKRGCCYDDTSSCNGVNCYYSFKEPTPFPPTLPSPTLPPPSKYDCGFESGMCGFTNQKGKDHFDWTRHKGSTASWGTGPTVDHTRGNSYGYYVYIETSKGKTGDRAVLMSPLIDFKNKSSPTVCVRFWYHMYGQHVGSLNLYYMSSNRLPYKPLWTRKGAIVNDWMYGQLVVPNSQFRVAFQGSRGSGYQGDVSIDDVSFINGDCPARTFCDFENNHLCGWSQDTSDNFDWRFGYGNTTSWNTGPKWDHTYKTSFGNYLYIEGSGRSPGDRARVESFPQNPTQGSCLEFYYNMKGSGIGTLSVYVKRGNRVDAYPAWTLRGEQGERWFRGFLTVKEPLMTWKIIMEAVRGVDYNLGVAIDDVHFHQRECTPKGDCDIENGESCGYENDPNNKVDWLIYSGPTPSHNTGPSVDHTTGLATGYYLYMEASSPARKGDKALFVSEKFTVNPNFQWCMEFCYHMFGTGAGALRVKSKYTYPRNKRVTYSRPLFEMEGNFDDKWFFGQANISSRYDFQVTTCTRNDLTPVKWAIALEWLLVH